MTNSKKILWALYYAFAAVAIIGLLALYASQADRAAAQVVGSGGGTISTLEQWTSDGTNITQRTANKPIKITGVTTGNCLTLNASHILVTTTCGSAGSSGLASSTPWTPGFATYVKDNGTLGAVATGTISASGPLSVTAGRSALGGAAAFSITQAGSGADGYLSSTDWNTFNNKQVAITAKTCTAGDFVSAVTGAGVFTCTTPASGGSAFPFTPTTNYNALTNATGTPMWFQTGLQASTTNNFFSGLTVENAGTAATLNIRGNSSTVGSGFNVTDGLAATNLFTSVVNPSGTSNANLATVPLSATFQTGAGTTGGIYFVSKAANSDIVFGAGASAFTGERLRIKGNTGNIGVASSSPYKLFSVGGDAVIGAATAGGTLGDLYLPKLGAAAGAFLAVDTAGKVIATTTPTSGSSYTATYPITLTGSAFGIDFGTTTSNTWAGTQTFTNPPIFTSLTSGGLGVNASGAVYKAATTTAGTGLTYSGGAFNVNTSQNISTLSNLTGDGFVKTSGGTGALSIDTNTYLTGNQTITLSGAVTGSGATSITTAFGTMAQGVLANPASTATIPTPQATSTLYGPVQNGKVLAGLGGILAYVATSTDSCSSGITCSYSGGTNSFSIGNGAISDAMLASTFVKTLTVNTAQGVSGSFSAGATPALSLTLGALTGVTSYNGLVVTANTGAITTGSWAATAIPASKGGTAIDTSASTGVPSISSGTWSVLSVTGSGSVVESASPTLTGTVTTANLLAVASSTIGAGAQATGLTVSGGATTTGFIVEQGTGTSTFAGGISTAKTINVQSTTATSTFANGIQLTGGCLQLPSGSICSASSGGITDVQTFTGSGTWTKPTTVANSQVRIQMWGAGGGGGGGNTGSSKKGAGGGGGGYFEFTVPASGLTSTVTVTIGAGGTAGASTPTAGGQGGNTTFGSYGTAYGGGGGFTASSGSPGGGGGGGAVSAGSAGVDVARTDGGGPSDGGNVLNGHGLFGGGEGYILGSGSMPGSSIYGGGGGAGCQFNSGGTSVYGGGGGGGGDGTCNGGTSLFGGNGGGGVTSGVGGAGVQPGGGGGGTGGTAAGGVGGAGKVVVTTFQ